MLNILENSTKRLDAASGIIVFLKGLELNEDEMLDAISLAQIVLATETAKEREQGCNGCTCMACLACDDDEEYDEFEDDEFFDEEDEDDDDDDEDNE